MGQLCSLRLPTVYKYCKSYLTQGHYGKLGCPAPSWTCQLFARDSEPPFFPIWGISPGFHLTRIQAGSALLQPLLSPRMVLVLPLCTRHTKAFPGFLPYSRPPPVPSSHLSATNTTANSQPQPLALGVCTHRPQTHSAKRIRVHIPTGIAGERLTGGRGSSNCGRL